MLRRFSGIEMDVPAGRVQDVALAPGAQAEVLLEDMEGRPQVLARGAEVWCVLDLPEALARLLAEAYLPPVKHGLGGWIATSSPLQQAYYRAPRALRKWLQRRVLDGLQGQLDRRPAGAFCTRFPVDTTGWALVRGTLGALRLAGAQVEEQPAWPGGSRACVVVTHDVEPTPYSYRHGLPRLLERLEAWGHPPHTIDPVAAPAARYAHLWQRADVLRHEIVCHGWRHDGRKTRLSPAGIRARLQLARTTLESLTGRAVTSFRSPRLDRSPALFEALEATGFRVDSTMPDVDRENTDHYGGGCSFNFPFHPLVPVGSGWRALSLLEMPVTAPDCAMPVFAGASEDEAIALYARKLDWVEAIGGCYVAIFHPGVFDDEDAQLRERLLTGFVRLLEGRPVWRCSLRDLEQWWRAREDLTTAASGS